MDEKEAILQYIMDYFGDFEIEGGPYISSNEGYFWVGVTDTGVTCAFAGDSWTKFPFSDPNIDFIEEIKKLKNSKTLEECERWYQLWRPSNG